MKVNCPHCHSGIEVIDEASLQEIDCPSCGSQFSLLGEDPMATLTDSRVTRTIGRFELLSKVGTGTFGSVWRAMDPQLDRTVAVKIPRKGQLDPEESEQFFREARAAAQLKHPNIVPVHEIGIDGGTIFIVSAFVQGVSLGDRLRNGPLGMKVTAEIVIKVCKALSHAHQLGIIHRDLKPANIMLDDRGEPHVMDFGLAKRETGEVTVTLDGQILGTPAYMSPEQAQGLTHEADCRSDIYSMGVILFQLLTGELPFRGNSQMLILQVLHDDAPSLTKLNSNIDRDLATITAKCLQKKPDKRYATADDLAADLQRFLQSEPILARPTGKLERLLRWRKRNPALATSIALASTLILMLAIGGPLVAIQQTASKKEAVKLREQYKAKFIEAEKAKTEATIAKKEATDEKDRAKLEQSRAEGEKKVAVAVRTFLQSNLLRQADVYSQANSGGKAKHDLTVLEALVRAAKEFAPEKITKKFPDQPDVQAEVLETIADTFSALDRHDLAIKFAEAAYKIREQASTEAYSPAILVGQVKLMFFWLNAENHVDAAKATVRLVNSFLRTLELSATDLEQGSLIDQEIDRRVDAVFDELLRFADPRKNNLPVLSIKNDLTPIEYVQIAANLFEIANKSKIIYAKLEQRFGKEDPRTNYILLIVALQSHAMAEFKRTAGLSNPIFSKIFGMDGGTFEDALEKYELVLQFLLKTSPSDHDMRIVAVRLVMAVAYKKRGQPGDIERAIEGLKICRRILIQELPPMHPAITMVDGNLSAAFLEIDELEEVLPILTSAVEDLHSIFGPDHRETIIANFQLAQAHNGLSQWKSKSAAERDEHFVTAIKLFLETIKRQQNINGDDHCDTAIAANDLAFAYFDRRDFVSAVEYFELAWKYRRKNLAENREDYLYTLSKLCYSLEQLDDDQKTLRYLEELAKLRFQHRKSYQHPEVIADHLTLAAAYARSGNEASAAMTLKKINRNEIGELSFKSSSQVDSRDLSDTDRRERGWIVTDMSLVQEGSKTQLEIDYKQVAGGRFRLYNKRTERQFSQIKKKQMSDGFELVKKLTYEIEDKEYTVSLWHPIQLGPNQSHPFKDQVSGETLKDDDRTDSRTAK